MCVEVRADEPILFGEPVVLTIKVISEKDISRLGVSLYHDVDSVVEGPQGWEKDLQDTMIYKGGASWGVAATANNTITFTRKLSLPPREGMFYIIARASTLNLEAIHEITIYMTREGGKVYLSGTPIPITPELLPVYTVTPGPSPTYVPTPTILVIPTNTITATSPAYPPPEGMGMPTSPPPEKLGTQAYPPPETPIP